MEVCNRMAKADIKTEQMKVGKSQGHCARAAMMVGRILLYFKAQEVWFVSPDGK